MHYEQAVRKLGDIQMRCQILLEAAMGLAYLHSQEGGFSAVVHLDVKRLAPFIFIMVHVHVLLNVQCMCWPCMVLTVCVVFQFQHIAG